MVYNDPYHLRRIIINLERHWQSSLYELSHEPNYFFYLLEFDLEGWNSKNENRNCFFIWYVSSTFLWWSDK